VGSWVHDDDDAPEIDLSDIDGDTFSAQPDASSATGSASDARSAPQGPDGRPVPPKVARAYRALEVPVGSDRATVKAGYRRMMKTYHQDRFDNDPDKRETAGEVSKRLNDAYERVTAYLDRVA
jgi:DnaJ-domain-containing protein 1